MALFLLFVLFFVTFFVVAMLWFCFLLYVIGVIFPRWGVVLCCCLCCCFCFSSLRLVPYCSWFSDWFFIVHGFLIGSLLFMVF